MRAIWRDAERRSATGRADATPRPEGILGRSDEAIGGAMPLVTLLPLSVAWALAPAAPVPHAVSQLLSTINAARFPSACSIIPNQCLTVSSTR